VRVCTRDRVCVRVRVRGTSSLSSSSSSTDAGAAAGHHCSRSPRVCVCVRANLDDIITFFLSPLSAAALLYGFPRILPAKSNAEISLFGPPFFFSSLFFFFIDSYSIRSHSHTCTHTDTINTYTYIIILTARVRLGRRYIIRAYLLFIYTYHIDECLHIYATIYIRVYMYTARTRIYNTRPCGYVVCTCAYECLLHGVFFIYLFFFLFALRVRRKTNSACILGVFAWPIRNGYAPRAHTTLRARTPPPPPRNDRITIIL